MKFEELQQQWESVKCEPKSDADLRRMMYSTPGSWRLRGLTGQEWIALSVNGLVVLALVIACDAFEKWIAALGTIAGISQILDRYWGLCYLKFHYQHGTLQDTLTHAMTRIKWRMAASYAVNILTWLVLVILSSASIDIAVLNAFAWGLLLLPVLAVLLWWNARMWSKNNQGVRIMLKEFGEEEDRNSTTLQGDPSFPRSVRFRRSG